MKHFFRNFLSVLIIAALFCSCTADTTSEEESSALEESSVPEESQEISLPEDIFQKHPVDDIYKNPLTDSELTKKLDAGDAIGVRYVEDNLLYILTINPVGNIRSKGGMLMKFAKYNLSEGSATVLATTRGYYDHANPFMLNKNDDGSVSVLIYNKFFRVENNTAVEEASYDKEVYANGVYSFASERLVCYDGTGNGNIILVDPKNPEPSLLYSAKKGFSFLSVSPNGEKTAFLNNGKIECYSINGEKLFETEEVNLQSMEYRIKWLNDDELLFFQCMEEEEYTEGFIADSEGATKKRIRFDYCLHEVQEDLQRSYPYMLASCYLRKGEYGGSGGFNNGIVLVNLEDSTAKLLRNTGSVISSFDIADDGKTVFWIEDNDLFVLNI